MRLKKGVFSNMWALSLIPHGALVWGTKDLEPGEFSNPGFQDSRIHVSCSLNSLKGGKGLL